MTTTKMDYPNPATRLTLVNSVNEMPRFYTFIEDLCENYRYTSTFCMEVQLALEEALVNVIHYAHPEEEGQHEITLDFEQRNDMAHFTLTDDGQPFDPTQHGQVDIEAPLEDRTVGGLGIHLVRNLMDTMHYTRDNNRNILCLSKTVERN